MRASKSTKQAILEWTIIAGSMITAVVVAEKIGLADKWENALVYTVMVFTIVIAILRTAWGSAIFWWRIAGLFLLHVIILATITQILSPESQGLRGIPMIIAGMAETLVIGSILWKGVRAPRKGCLPEDTTST